jgi:hypothetical protein
MRKLVIAEIKPDSFKTIQTEVARELKCLAYLNSVSVQNGNYYIVGRAHINRFVAALKTKLNECRELFKDLESITEFDQDEALLDSFLNLKAS